MTMETHYMRKIFLLLVTLAIAGCGNSHSDDSTSSEPPKRSVLDDAENICKAVSAGLATQCAVHVFSDTVDVTIDTDGAEARKICKGIAVEMSKHTNNFTLTDWKLQIFSPYSGEKPIAICNLDITKS